MKVSEVAFFGHPVASLKQARLFYERVLRLAPPVAIDGGLEDDMGFLEYQIGTSTLAITTSWSDGRKPGFPSSGLVLEMDDFQEAVEHIRSCGVEFELGPYEGPSCSVAVFLDPDGNRIGIHKRKA